MRGDETRTGAHHGIRPAAAHHPNRVITCGSPPIATAPFQWRLQTATGTLGLWECRNAQ